nr:NS protein [Avian orthoreovirus]
MPLHLRSMKCEISRVGFCHIAYRECITPSFQVHVNDKGVESIFDVLVDYSNVNYPEVPKALCSGPFQLQVILNKKYVPRASLTDCCFFECSLVPFENGVRSLPVGSKSELVIHWNGQTNSRAAKRGSRIDFVFGSEC